ncbi:MAG: ABC transporter substrate-binding protein [SAR324 cluster bacterium]|nr:ABC transporter substrate-binding protein [SAR324 cluster bacterium]
MKKIGLLLLGFACVSTSLFAQSVDDLEFITENYAPYNYKKDGKIQGIAVDALVEMFKIVGSQKTLEDIKLWPWARGYKIVQQKKNTSLFSTTRTEAREKLFKWVGPLSPSNIVLLAKKSRRIKLNSVDELNSNEYKKTAAIRDDAGELILLGLGVPPNRIERTNSGLSGIRMLEKNKVDMLAYGHVVGLWYIKELGFDPGEFEAVYVLKKSYLYYAFHKDTDDKIITQLQKALDELKANGKLEKISKKYVN